MITDWRAITSTPSDLSATQWRRFTASEAVAELLRILRKLNELEQFMSFLLVLGVENPL